VQVKDASNNAAGKNAIREKALRLNDDLENWIDIAHEAFMGCDDELEKARLDGKLKAYWEVKNHVEEMLEIDKKIDWSKVPVDTPIWVKGLKSAMWRKRYFAGIKDGLVCGWKNGKTSWTVESEDEWNYWNYAMLAEDVDYPQVNSQWHNLKDQKPEDRQEVLTWDGIGVELDRWSDDEDYFENTDAEDIWWMELPEPPQRGANYE